MLNEGDLILTGTGAGVGLVSKGNVIETEMHWEGKQLSMMNQVL